MPRTESRARDLAGQIITFMETGTPQEGLFTPDVFCDLTPARSCSTALLRDTSSAHNFRSAAGSRRYGSSSPWRASVCALRYMPVLLMLMSLKLVSARPGDSVASSLTRRPAPCSERCRPARISASQYSPQICCWSPLRTTACGRIRARSVPQIADTADHLGGA